MPTLKISFHLLHRTECGGDTTEQRRPVWRPQQRSRRRMLLVVWTWAQAPGVEEDKCSVQFVSEGQKVLAGWMVHTCMRRGDGCAIRKGLEPLGK